MAIPPESDPVIFPPDQLHKFYSLKGKGLERVIQLLEENVVYFSTRTQFNDPWDCRPNFEYFTPPEKMGELFQSLLFKFPKSETAQMLNDAEVMAENWRHNPGQHRSDQIRIQHEVLDACGIFCLTASKSAPLLWSHYADAHRGVCLTFSTQNSDSIFFQAQKIRYQWQYPVARLDDEETFRFIEACLLTKSVDWAYEDEWRVWLRRESGLKPFRPEELLAITFGACVDKKVKLRLTEIALKRGFPLKIYETRLGSTHYSLEFKPMQMP